MKGAGVPGNCAGRQGSASKPFTAGRASLGMEVSEAKRKRELEAENRKLKELVADLSLDNKILKEIVSKN